MSELPVDYWLCFMCKKKIITDGSAMDARDQLTQLKDEVRNLKHELHELRKEVASRQDMGCGLSYRASMPICTDWYVDGQQHIQAAYGVQDMQEGKERGRGV